MKKDNIPKEQIKIKNHSNNALRPGNIISLIGTRGSGKSVAVKAICHYFRYMPRFIVVSLTERNNKFFSNFVPSNCIMYEWNPKILQRLYKYQDELIDKYGKED